MDLSALPTSSSNQQPSTTTASPSSSSQQPSACIRALEFFSGIGGLHHGLEFSGHPNASVLGSFDINPVSNQVYTHNFNIEPRQKVVEVLSVKDLEKFKSNCWLLSPPCQPYTQGGKKLDNKDPRAKGLLYLINILPKLPNPPTFILLENVLNFESSKSRDLLVSALTKLNYIVDEWLLTPTQFGIPNDRKRYYLTARRRDVNAENGLVNGVNGIKVSDDDAGTGKDGNDDDDTVPPLNLRKTWPFPDWVGEVPSLSEFLEDDVTEGGITSVMPSQRNDSITTTSNSSSTPPTQNSTASSDEEIDDDVEEGEEEFGNGAGLYKIPENFVKNRKYISPGYVVVPMDRTSPCFTKAYGRHGVGAGAFLQTKGFNLSKNLIDPISAAETLGLRLFTPTEYVVNSERSRSFYRFKITKTSKSKRQINSI
ncbi:C-5 cytosine-specific DNA methylase [Blyttiomyces sp. JEL0837]|nr:C-5 cytosine-specific DNA methylase [Blyttiomyces sp. JEL0837]